MRTMSASALAVIARSTSAAVGASTTSTPSGAAIARFDAISVTSAPRRRASSASATPMRPEDRLPTKRTASSGSRVPPALTSTRLPWSVPLRAPSSSWTRSKISSGSDILPTPSSPSAGLALVRPDQLDAALPQRRRVRLGRRVGPHAWIHRGRDEHGAAVGERSLGEHVVGEPIGELGHRVRRQRGDHEQVGARQVRIQVFLRRPPGKCGEGLPPHEPVGAARDERNDIVPRANEQACQVAGLVGGDSAGDSEEDPCHADIVPTPPQNENARPRPPSPNVTPERRPGSDFGTPYGRAA